MIQIEKRYDNVGLLEEGKVNEILKAVRKALMETPVQYMTISYSSMVERIDDEQFITPKHLSSISIDFC